MISLINLAEYLLLSYMKYFRPIDLLCLCQFARTSKLLLIALAQGQEIFPWFLSCLALRMQNAFNGCKEGRMWIFCKNCTFFSFFWRGRKRAMTYHRTKCICFIPIIKIKKIMRKFLHLIRKKNVKDWSTIKKQINTFVNFDTYLFLLDTWYR